MITIPLIGKLLKRTNLIDKRLEKMDKEVGEMAKNPKWIEYCNNYGNKSQGGRGMSKKPK